MPFEIEEVESIHSSELFLSSVKESNPHLDMQKVENTLNFSYKAHKNQFRKSGTPFSVHPVEVAKMLAEMKMNTETVCAALLHDVIEDTRFTYNDIKEEFGETIANLVEGVTKVNAITMKSAKEAQVATYRKMLLSTAKDIRVVMIKFVDRLHNLRTLKYLPEKKRKIIAFETINIYAPMANRLGMAKVRWEMEDLSFKFLYTEEYEEIVKKVISTREEREEQLSYFKTTLMDALTIEGIKAEISGRTKHFFSIYRKMQTGKNFDDIFDILGIRITVDTKSECYTALGIVHSLWIPLQTRFKDYIAVPKSNMYQSLHTAVVGPKGKIIDVQIRTKEMHLVAEDGVAAHWMYKSKKNQGNPSEMEWIKQMVDWQQDLTNPDEFMNFFKIDLYESEIFVLSPQGDLIQLPKGSTVLDFAFNVHSDIGLKCVAAKVDGNTVQMDATLISGTTIEIITAPFQQPSPHWMNIVKTSKAKSEIRKWLKITESKNNIELGEKIMASELQRFNIIEDWKENFIQALGDIGEAKLPSILESIGQGNTSAIIVLDKIFPKKKLLNQVKKKKSTWKNIIPLPKKLFSKKIIEKDSAVTFSGNEYKESNILLGKCCQPIPGDSVVGYQLEKKGIEIHRHSCTESVMMMNNIEKKINVFWKPEDGSLFKIKCTVVGINRPFLLSDITKAISSTKTNIINANVSLNDKLAHNVFLIEVKDLDQLNRVFKTIRSTKGIKTVTRDVNLENF